jgi:hypothetical protein
MDGLLRRIYTGETDYRRAVDTEAWKALRDVFGRAVEEGFGTAAPTDSLFYEELKYNTGVFAAFRQHAMQEAIAAQMTDAQGGLKPFAGFRRDVKAYVEPAWLDSWLETEYNTAVNRAHTAAIRRRAERDRNVLPNLRWAPSTSIHPGKDHTVFWNVVRPVDDPFWDRHSPGDRWNCKCSLEATDDGVTPLPGGEKEDLPAPGLDNHILRDAKVFGDNHPFIKKASRKAKKTVGRFVKENMPAPEITEKIFRSGGIIQTQGRQNRKEEKKNRMACTFLAKEFGEKYRLPGINNVPGKSNPGALNLTTGMLSGVKVQEGKNLKNTLQNAARRASAQGAGELYVYLIHDYGAQEIRDALKAAFQKGRNRHVKKVIIRLADGEVKRYDAGMLRRAFK